MSRSEGRLKAPPRDVTQENRDRQDGGGTATLLRVRWFNES
jgi:hypothetical protein